MLICGEDGPSGGQDMCNHVKPAWFLKHNERAWDAYSTAGVNVGTRRPQSVRFCCTRTTNCCTRKRSSTLGSREVQPSVRLILVCSSGTSCLVHKVLLHSTLLHRMIKPPSSVLHFYVLLVHLQDIKHTQRHCILSEYLLHSLSQISLWCGTDACWIHFAFEMASAEAQPLLCTIHISCTFSLLQASSSSCMTCTASSLVMPGQCLASNTASDT